MQLELTKTTFRRFVWFQLGCALMALGVSIYELANPRWLAFDSEFDKLALSYFGGKELSTEFLVFSGVVFVIDLVALIGLLFFKNWARLLFTVTTLISLPASSIGVGPVSYSSSAVSLLDWVCSAGLGCLLLMAYAKGAGSEWFSPASLAEVDGK